MRAFRKYESQRNIIKIQKYKEICAWIYLKFLFIILYESQSTIQSFSHWQTILTYILQELILNVDLAYSWSASTWSTRQNFFYILIFNMRSVFIDYKKSEINISKHQNQMIFKIKLWKLNNKWANHLILKNVKQTLNDNKSINTFTFDFEVWRKFNSILLMFLKLFHRILKDESQAC